MKVSLNRSDHFILAIVSAFGVYVLLFIYFQVTEYKQTIQLTEKDDFSRIEDVKEIEIKKQNIEVPNVNSKEVKNIVRNNEDTREKSNENWSENSPTNDPEKSIKDFEKKLFEDARGNKPQNQVVKTSEEQNIQKQVTDTKVKVNNSGNKSNQYSGNVMVDFYLPGRTAYDNNNWHIRNPGYTCGFGSSGVVVINIEVNLSGKVIKITYDASKSSNASSCMIQQAKKYAQMSRFNFSGNSDNEASGYIRYQFISQ